MDLEYFISGPGFSIHLASLSFTDRSLCVALRAIHGLIAHHRDTTKNFLTTSLVLASRHLASHKQVLLTFGSTLTVRPRMPSKPCPYCPKKFAKQSVLDTHIKHVHPTTTAIKPEKLENESPKTVIRARSQEPGMKSQSRGVSYPPVVRSASLGFRVFLPLMRRVWRQGKADFFLV